MPTTILLAWNHGEHVKATIIPNKYALRRWIRQVVYRFKVDIAVKQRGNVLKRNKLISTKNR